MAESTLTRAQAGDQVAFRELVAAYEPELRVHCYRMVGSLHDAEDLLQETLLAAWRGLPGFEGRASVRSWLYRIATNRCLNALRDGGRRPPASPVPPFSPPEPTRHGDVMWLQPYPDALLDGVADGSAGPDARYAAREAIELAFVAALQRLPPRHTAVLVLRDVLGFSTAEVAEMLDTTEVAIKGVLQRARASLERWRQTSGARSAGSATETPEVVRRFAEAFAADDVDGVVALMTADAWLTMPPAPHEYEGSVAIADFLRASATWRAGRRFQLLTASANGQPAFACYLAEASEKLARPAGLLVLTVTGARIAAITRFLDVSLFTDFRLPDTIPAAGSAWRDEQQLAGGAPSL